MMRPVLLLLGAGVLLSACSNNGEDELRQWMARERSQIHPKVEVVPEPKKFEPQAYTEANAIDPFSSEKLARALRRDNGPNVVNAALLAPELARRKEPLENYPLDAMTMVGSLVKTGKPVALIKIDNMLYQVRPGQYLGQNYGRVMKVGETEVVLREIVQDPTGEWVERTATLQLQERGK